MSRIYVGENSIGGVKMFGSQATSLFPFNPTPTEPRIYFTSELSTTGINIGPYADASSGATITVHWSDGTTNDNGGGNAYLNMTKTFGTDELRQHYITCDPPEHLYRIGHRDSTQNWGTNNWDGLSGFSNLFYVYFYQNSCPASMSNLNLYGCSKVRQLHLLRTSASPAQVDQWLIDVNNATSGETITGDNFYCPSIRTSASDAAVAAMQANGWTFSFSVSCYGV